MSGYGAIREADTNPALRKLVGDPPSGYRFAAVCAVKLQMDLYLTPNPMPQENIYSVPEGSFLVGIVRYPDAAAMERDLGFHNG